jgi:hypothetical protein
MDNEVTMKTVIEAILMIIVAIVGALMARGLVNRGLYKIPAYIFQSLI